MAQFLGRFLEAAPVGPGGADIDDVKHDENDPHFQDVTHLRRDVHLMIAKLFEMGVTTGTASRRFSPDEPVKRAQMALFITRALAHTNARPAGITVQTGPRTLTSRDVADLVISVRDSTHRPVPDALVDVFHVPSRKAGFDSDGECTYRATPEFGDQACVIDPGDATTGEGGNLVFDLFVDEDLVLWAWTGDRDEEFDLDETRFVSVQFDAVEPATGFLLTDDLPPGAVKAPYGRSVTVTFQLVDEHEDPVEQEKVEILVRTEEDRGRDGTRVRTQTYYTDESGRVQFVYLVDRDESRTTGDAYFGIEVLESFDLEVIDRSSVGLIGGEDQGDPNRISWSDEEARPNALLLVLSRAYDLASDYGLGRRNGVTALLVDQYGDPVSGEWVHFKSDDPDGLWQDPGNADLAKPAFRLLTNRQGKAGTIYNRDSDRSRIETIEAFVENRDIRAEPVEHYWVLEAPDDGDDHTYEVIVHDHKRRTLVLEYNAGEYFLARYDRNDRYRYDGLDEDFESFATHLEEGDIVEISIRSRDPNDVNVFERF